MDEIWEEIDSAEDAGETSIKVDPERLKLEDLDFLDKMGYDVEYKKLSNIHYYIISWELQ